MPLRPTGAGLESHQELRGSALMPSELEITSETGLMKYGRTRTMTTRNTDECCQVIAIAGKHSTNLRVIPSGARRPRFSLRSESRRVGHHSCSAASVEYSRRIRSIKSWFERCPLRPTRVFTGKPRRKENTVDRPSPCLLLDAGSFGGTFSAVRWPQTSLSAQCRSGQSRHFRGRSLRMSLRYARVGRTG